MTAMTASLPLPCRKVAREQNRIVLWASFHILCATCLGMGLYYIRQYMLHPDKVIIQDAGGNLYRGSSGPLLCREAAEDAARRAAIAFLERSWEHEHREMREAIFGKTAQKAVADLISRSKDEFADQKIRQIPDISLIRVQAAPEPDQCLVRVQGVLHRTGIYMGMPYYQQLEYNLGLRLMRSPDARTFPLRVLRMTYEERSLYDGKGRKTP